MYESKLKSEFLNISLSGKNPSFLRSSEKLSPYNQKSNHSQNKSQISKKKVPILQQNYHENFTISTTPAAKQIKNSNAINDKKKITKNENITYQNYVTNSKKIDLSPLNISFNNNRNEKHRNKSLDIEKGNLNVS